jgi:hypothetical protein
MTKWDSGRGQIFNIFLAWHTNRQIIMMNGAFGWLEQDSWQVAARVIKNPVWETNHRGRIFDELWIGEMGH